MKGNKYITFSFDDGVEDDVRLVKLMNSYGLKGTFNLNAGRLTGTSSFVYCGVKRVKMLNYFEYSNLYEGHEIAGHSYTHAHLEQLDKGTLDNEIRLDKKILEHLYDCKIQGMVYPFGTYNDVVVEALRNNHIKYCRTTLATHNFMLPEEPLTWHPTCHFRDKSIMELAEQFFACNSQKDMVFYIWGHSYELVTDEDWEEFEQFCRFISRRENIHYCTNIEILKKL